MKNLSEQEKNALMNALVNQGFFGPGEPGEVIRALSDMGYTYRKGRRYALNVAGEMRARECYDQALDMAFPVE